MATKKKGRGRPTKTTGKIKTKYVYLTDAEEAKVIKKHGNLSKALRVGVLGVTA